MSEELTPRQQILLWDLVSRGGSALQKDIKPSVVAADRKRLEQTKLLTVSKEKLGALRLTLNDEVCWDYLGSYPLAPGESDRGSIHDRHILQFILGRIREFSKVNDCSLSQVIAAKRIVFNDDKERPQQSTNASSVSDTIRREIIDAFFEIAGHPPKSQVRLHTLRRRLAHIPRKILDKALIEMREMRQANFSRLSNPSDIAAEGDATLTIKDQQFHTIWVEP